MIGSLGVDITGKFHETPKDSPTNSIYAIRVISAEKNHPKSMRPASKTTAYILVDKIPSLPNTCHHMFFCWVSWGPKYRKFTFVVFGSHTWVFRGKLTQMTSQSHLQVEPVFVGYICLIGVSSHYRTSSDGGGLWMSVKNTSPIHGMILSNWLYVYIYRFITLGFGEI